MTELIVALDGPAPRRLRYQLYEEGGVNWFKIGPQAMARKEWPSLIYHGGNIKTFLDLKLCDTRATVREAVKRFAAAGVAAVSTFTDEATQEAVRAAENSTLKVWQVIELTDAAEERSTVVRGLFSRKARTNGAAGVVCSGSAVSGIIAHDGFGMDIVVPGIRMDIGSGGGHRETWGPGFAREAGATYIVVGRPIWQAADPVAAAKEFMDALT
jgi:orotidine-5'-phosphate decarboxylase